LNTQNSRMTANPRIYQIRSEKFQTNPNGEGEYFEAVFEGDSLGVFEYTSEGVEEVKAILRERSLAFRRNSILFLCPNHS